MTQKKTKKPWFKFYPVKWAGDEQLGMCSLAARGLWMEMLCVMHRAEPYGHFLVNGLQPSNEQVAALARANADEVRSLLLELKIARVFSVSRNGTIYSRRMTEDEKRRKAGEEAQINGGSEPERRPHEVIENKRRSRLPPRSGPRLPPSIESRVYISPPSPSRDFTSAEFEQWKNWVERFYASGFWLSERGPRPGEDDFEGPKELVKSQQTSPEG